MIGQQIHSASQRTQAGAGLTELSLLVLAIGLLMVIAVYKIGQLRAEAEWVAFLQVVAALKQNLAVELIRTTQQDGTGALARLDHSNPMTLLAEPPMTYRGELGQPNPATIPGYQWYFDLRERALVYRVEYDKPFRSPLPGPARIRLQLQMDYSDDDRNGRFTPGVDLPRNIALVALEPYRWLEASED